MEKSWKIHYTWSFPTVMWIYQRVDPFFACKVINQSKPAYCCAGNVLVGLVGDEKHLECNAVTKIGSLDILVYNPLGKPHNLQHQVYMIHNIPKCQVRYATVRFWWLSMLPLSQHRKHHFTIFFHLRCRPFAATSPNPAACDRKWAEMVCHFQGATSSASIKA